MPNWRRVTAIQKFQISNRKLFKKIKEIIYPTRPSHTHSFVGLLTSNPFEKPRGENFTILMPGS